MTAAEINTVLEEIVGKGVSLTVNTYVILICGWVISTFLGAFIGSYWKKRGETAAIQTDLRTIKDQLAQTTSVAETIKAEISGAYGLKQKRWDTKWQCYSEITEDLADLASVIQETMAPQPDPDPEKRRRTEKARDLVERIRRSAGRARIAVAPDVRTLLSSFANDWNLAKTNGQQYQVAFKAWVKVTDAARADLYGEPRETGSWEQNDVKQSQ